MGYMTDRCCYVGASYHGYQHDRMSTKHLRLRVEGCPSFASGSISARSSSVCALNTWERIIL
jgi:hypothetical protein